MLLSSVLLLSTFTNSVSASSANVKSFSTQHSDTFLQKKQFFFSSFLSSHLPLNTQTHTQTQSVFWEMASVFQLACNGPLTRLASGVFGLQQMLLWIGRSSAACRLYWIVIRVELTIHGRGSGFMWEGMLLHQVIFILFLSVGFLTKVGAVWLAGRKTVYFYMHQGDGVCYIILSR